MIIALEDAPLPVYLRLSSPMSDDDLLQFCAANEMLRVEREPNGELLLMTPAGNRSSRRNVAILGELYLWARSDDRGYAFDSNTGFNLPDGSMRSPDAAWVSKALWDSSTDGEKERFSPISPEFIIELRSATDRLPALETKMEQWMSNGVELAWLIDPQRKGVTIYRQGQPPEHLDNPLVVHGTGPVAGFELIMTPIWS